MQNFDPGAIPVVTIAVSGPGSQRDISEYVDKNLRRRLETVYGVGQVLVIGARPRQINVIVDNAKLAAQGLTAAQVVAALQSQNIQIPGGKVEQGLRDLTLRTYGRVGIAGGVRQHPDRERQRHADPRARRRAHRGQHVRGRVGGDGERQARGRADGAQAVRHQRHRGRRTASRSASKRCARSCPPGYKLDVIRDQSEFVLAAVGAVKEHLILGSIFAALDRVAVPLLAALLAPCW